MEYKARGLVRLVANRELMSRTEALLGVHDGFEHHVTDFLGPPEKMVLGKGHNMPFPAGKKKEKNVREGVKMHFAPFGHLWGPPWRLPNEHLLTFLDGLVVDCTLDLGMPSVLAMAP